jgi:hypothetical protein
MTPTTTATLGEGPRRADSGWLKDEVMASPEAGEEVWW